MMVSPDPDSNTPDPREGYQPTPHVCQQCDHPLTQHDRHGSCRAFEMAPYLGLCGCESGPGETRADPHSEEERAPQDRGCRYCQAHPGEWCEYDCGSPNAAIHPDYRPRERLMADDRSILPDGSDSKTSPPRECENSIDVTPGVVWTDSQVAVVRQITARMVTAEAAVRRVEALTYASDDGSEWGHNFGCDGEPECPACWAQSIRAALVGAL